MAAEARHRYVNPHTDLGGSDVGPDEWNDGHDLFGDPYSVPFLLGCFDEYAEGQVHEVLVADQAEAEAGASNSTMMTPLRVAQAIAALGDGPLFVQTTVPSSPSPGDRWMDLLNGNLFTRVDDGNTEQWVELGPAPPLADVEIFGIEFLGVSEDISAGSVFTFSSEDFGEDTPSREIVVIATGASDTESYAIASMTIGGVSATKLVGANENITERYQTVSMWQAKPTGPSGDIVVTFSESIDYGGRIAVYRMVGANATPTDTAFDDSQPHSEELTIPTGGGAIGMTNFVRDGTGDRTVAWTEMDEEDHDSSVSGAIFSSSARHFTAGTATRVATPSDTVHVNSGGYVLAAWEPASSAIDFPASPSMDQEYTSGPRTWKWNNRGWVLLNLSYASEAQAQAGMDLLTIMTPIRTADAITAQLPTVAQAEAEAGTATDRRAWTAERVAQAVAALGGGGGVESGTREDFQQTAAPTGWTKETNADYNDATPRCITGTVGVGGTRAFSAVFGTTAVEAHAITTAELSSHPHGNSFSVGNTSINRSPTNPSTPAGPGHAATNPGSAPSWPHGHPFSGSISSAGSGSAHVHDLDLQAKFVDFIIAVKT